MSHYLLTYDIGSTSCKSCLYELDGTLKLAASASEYYGLYHTDGGGVEQNPDEWWQAMVATTRRIMQAMNGTVTVEGVSFCAQMQGLVLVDKDLRHLRPAMSYMDQRAAEQKAAAIEHGLRIEGINAIKLLKSLKINGAIAASVKDPVFKYKWVEQNEPDIYGRIYKWLDVKDYLIARATGVCAMTADSAFATFLAGNCGGKLYWSDALLRMYKVKKEHMPDIVNPVDRVGALHARAADELGLPAGIPVFGGGGDASMITIGAGATRLHDTYVYTGTSGWVSSLVDRPKVDVARRVAAIVGAQTDHGYYNYFAEQETAGKCLEWVKDHLALDEINIYLEKRHVAEDVEARFTSLYEYLISVIEKVPAGSGGVIFTPWLHGNRCPFEDPNARGIFFNLSLSTGKAAMIRAVVEGVIFHQKWMLESIRKSFPVKGPLRFAGGGALSSVMAQILSDIMELPVARVADPQNAGAAGAALTAAAGLGLIPDLESAAHYVPILETYQPNSDCFAVYRKNYSIFKELYRVNRRLFAGD